MNAHVPSPLAYELVDYLKVSIAGDPFLGTAGYPWRDRKMHVRLQTPTEITNNNNQEAVSPWLDRVVRDKQLLNDPARSISPPQPRPPVALVRREAFEAHERNFTGVTVLGAGFLRFSCPRSAYRETDILSSVSCFAPRPRDLRL